MYTVWPLVTVRNQLPAQEVNLASNVEITRGSLFDRYSYGRISVKRGSLPTTLKSFSPFVLTYVRRFLVSSTCSFSGSRYSRCSTVTDPRIYFDVRYPIHAPFILPTIIDSLLLTSLCVPCMCTFFSSFYYYYFFSIV